MNIHRKLVSHGEKNIYVKDNASIEFSLKSMVAFVIIAFFFFFLLIANQLVTHIIMQTKASDSIIINISGRQRMINQSILKESIRFYYYDNTNDFSSSVDELKKLLLLWENSQQILKYGDVKLSIPENKPKLIEDLFIEIDPFFNAILNSTKKLILIVENGDYNKVDIRNLITILKENEKIYLTKMDNIVYAYEFESMRKLDRLKLYTWGVNDFSFICINTRNNFYF